MSERFYHTDGGRREFLQSSEWLKCKKEYNLPPVKHSKDCGVRSISCLLAGMNRRHAGLATYREALLLLGKCFDDEQQQRHGLNDVSRAFSNFTEGGVQSTALHLAAFRLGLNEVDRITCVTQIPTNFSGLLQTQDHIFCVWAGTVFDYYNPTIKTKRRSYHKFVYHCFEYPAPRKFITYCR